MSHLTDDSTNLVKLFSKFDEKRHLVTNAILHLHSYSQQHTMSSSKNFKIPKNPSDNSEKGSARRPGSDSSKTSAQDLARQSGTSTSGSARRPGSSAQGSARRPGPSSSPGVQDSARRSGATSAPMSRRSSSTSEKDHERPKQSQHQIPVCAGKI